MADIEIGKELKFENLISLRKRMTQAEMQQELIKLGSYMKENNIRKVGPLISATFAIEEINGQQLIDSEFLIPIDRKVDLPSEYKYKDKFHLVNAVYIRYVGDPHGLQQPYNELSLYLQENNLQQITVGYNVNVNDEKVHLGEQHIIDVYMGVNPSIL